MKTTFQTARWAGWAGLLAGAMDFATGLGMIMLPAITLKLMRVTVPTEEALFYLRFVGVFVGSVGFSYLWAWRTGSAALRESFRFTIPFRIGAGTFCLVAVSRGAMEPMWLSVTLADYGWVGVQIWFLRREWEDL